MSFVLGVDTVQGRVRVSHSGPIVSIRHSLTTPVEVNTFTGRALIRGSTAKPKAHVNTINRFFELVHAERYEAGVRQGSVYLRDKRKGNRVPVPVAGLMVILPTLSIMTIMAEEYDAYFVKRWRERWQEARQNAAP